MKSPANLMKDFRGPHDERIRRGVGAENCCRLKVKRLPSLYGSRNTIFKLERSVTTLLLVP